MHQPEIIRQQTPAGTRISLRDQHGNETDMGEIRPVRHHPGWWQLADRNGRRLGTITGSESDAEQLIIAAATINH